MRIKELEEKQKKDHFCDKLVEAYNEQRISLNRHNIREGIKNR